MSIHIGAKTGAIAETVLLPGDPLRARFIAEKLLENSTCYSEVRGMLGYTGTYKGKKVSVQGTGMGLPSLSIYVNELMDTYGARQLIRIGTCGSFQNHIRLGDIVIGMSACSESNMNRRTFKGMDFAPTADFELLKRTYEVASEIGRGVHVGSVLSADVFYNEDSEEWRLWARYGVLAVDMESSALYTLAARKGRRALSLLTVSDSMVSGEKSSSQEREQGLLDMVRIALEATTIAET